MKDIRRISKCLYHVISEPGDYTRYDYFVYRSGPDDFCFMPGESTFRFPQRLNYWMVHRADLDMALVAHDERCSPHTLAECIRTLCEIRDGDE